MTTKLLIALAVVLGATSAGWAQSQRNFGPNGPATGDTFGEPYSGTYAARHADRYLQRHWHSRAHWRAW